MAVPAPMTWHQLQKKVLVNCEIPNLTDVAITIGEKSFSFAAKAGGKEFQMDVPLAHDVVVEESRWFGNDRAVSIVLTKTDNSCFWEKLSTDTPLAQLGMGYLATRVAEFADVVFFELERIREKNEEGAAKAQSLADAIQAVLDAQKELSSQVGQALDGSDALRSEALQEAWKALSVQANDLAVRMDQMSQRLSESGDPMRFTAQMAEFAVSDARDVMESVRVRDLAEALRAAERLSVRWSATEERAQIEGRMSGSEPLSQDTLDDMGERISSIREALREQDAEDRKASAGAAAQMQTSVGPQMDLAGQMDTLQEDAERVAQELPVTPRGMLKELDDAEVRMEEAGGQLRTGLGQSGLASQLAAQDHLRRALEALQEAMSSSSSQTPSEGGGGQDDGEPSEPSDEQEDEDADATSRIELPEPEAFRTPEDYRRMLLLGMEGDVPEGFEALKRRYYEELVHQ